MNNSDKIRLETIYVDILKDNMLLLSEMIVVGQGLGDCNIIAYKSKIWKLNQNTYDIEDSVIDDIYNTLGYKIGTNDPLKVIQGMIINLNYGNNEILFGSMENGELIIDDKYFPMIKSPKESILFKKVVETLHPRNIKFTSDVLKIIDRASFKRRVDSDMIFYHGTISNYLINIIRKGLDKDTINSNYPKSVKNIIKGRTFITSNFQYAFSHAVRAAKIHDAYPVVISFRVRFEDLLQPDYDVGRDSKNDSTALKISREMGIYGYGGNILPTDFETVFYSLVQKAHSDQYSDNLIKHVEAQTLHWLITTKGVNFDNMEEYINPII